MKFYEIPESMIAESLRQISFKVAIAVLERRSSTVPLHTKQACGVCRGNRGVIPLYQESGRDKTGFKTGYGGSEEHSYKSNRAVNVRGTEQGKPPAFVAGGRLLFCRGIRNDSR